MTKKNKQQRTPPAKDKLFEEKIKYLNEKKAAKVAIQAEKMIKKGIFKEVLPIDAPVFSSNSTEATEMLEVETNIEVSTGDAGLTTSNVELTVQDKEEVPPPITVMPDDLNKDGASSLKAAASSKPHGHDSIDAAPTTPVIPPTKAASQGSGVVGSYAEAVRGFGSGSSIAVPHRELSLDMIPINNGARSDETDGNSHVEPEGSISLGSQDTVPIITNKEHGKTDKVPKQWSALFRDNRAPNSGLKLEYFPPTGEKLDFSHLEVPSLVEIWGHCLVGYFTGRFPGLKAIHDMTAKWKVEVHVKSHSKGWVIFKFKSEEDRLHVLAEGPYVLFGKTMYLKELSDDFSTDDEEFLKLPIWVKFPKLSMRLWKAKEIGMIASQVGIPITTDKVTQDAVYTHFARVLIEVDVSKPPVLQFPIIPPSGKEYMQQVIYETFPEYCFHCKKYGHHPFTCLILNPPKEKVMGLLTAKEKGKGAATPSPDIHDANEPPFIMVNRNNKKGIFVRKGLLTNVGASTSQPIAPNPQPNEKDPAAAISTASGSFSLAETMEEAVLSIEYDPIFEWEGRMVKSVHELESDDIINKFVTKEDGAHIAFVKKRHQIKSYVPVSRLKKNFQRETNLEAPAMVFTDPCLVALPGVRRTRTWYNFNKSIFTPNVASFFDVQARHNVVFLQRKQLSAIECSSNLDANGYVSTCNPTGSKVLSQATHPTARPSAKPTTKDKAQHPITLVASTSQPTPFEESRGDQAINGGKGYLVTNMYEMGYDDVITSFTVNEEGKTVAYAWETDQIPKGVNIVKLGPKLDPNPCDDTGVNFTEDLLLSCPEVKRNGEWYDFDKPAFTHRVLSFFDPNQDRNKKYLKEMRKRARKQMKEKGGIDPEDEAYSSDLYLS
ncbi:unnamed protein product [Cuscuta epithymum]|uniref:DUF4283 domain-containing protein n=1 Tax=Cuscuta epithymum TaxID=186058 RepID=A0AAV0GBW0_9ASTE|nr:unnamed protein product [Cuscuta epithymum]